LRRKTEKASFDQTSSNSFVKCMPEKRKFENVTSVSGTEDEYHEEHNKIVKNKPVETAAYGFGVLNSCQNSILDLTCIFCNRICSTFGNLKRHMFTHTGERPFSCSLCGKGFIRKNRLFEHISSVHQGQRPYTCDICSKAFALKHNLVAHMNYHLPQARLSCCLCEKQFKYRGDLSKHMKRKHNESVEFGKNCVMLEQFDTPKIESQTENGDNDMPEPSDFLNARDDENENKENYVGEVACKIELPDDDYGISSVVGEHEPERKSEKLYHCDTCDKRFAKRCQLERHLLTHSENKPFHCSLCGQGFIRRDGLKVHIYAVHTGYRPFSCEVCSKTFTTQSHYKTHVLCHAAERTFLCKYCNKGFKTNSNLLKHVKRNHKSEKSLVGVTAPERKHVCVVCNRRFLCEEELKQHEKRCTGKRYICVVCNKDYVELRSFQQHEERHRTETGNVYKCVECGAGIKGYDNMKKHAKICNTKKFSGSR
jgi:KRAB domain-containing zinc finger protein